MVMTGRIRGTGIRVRIETNVGNDLWRDDAACRYSDPEIFYPVSAKNSVSVQADLTEQAKRLCAGCPVIESCRSDVDAMETHLPQMYGIRAGETEKERLARRRKADRVRRAARS